MKRAFLLFVALILGCAAAPFDPFGEARIDEHPGVQIPMNEIFRDENGTPTTLARLGHARPILLVPVLHDCPNLCGITLDGLASAMQDTGVVGDHDASVIAFGIDANETAANARAALGRLIGRHPELLGRIHATVGRDVAVHRVTDALGYRFAYDPRIRQFAHAAAVAILTPDGRFSRWLYGIAPEPAALKSGLSDARAGRTGGWVQQLILLCYHYDPATGRYGVAINWLLRVGCLATVLAVLLYVILARRRERVRRA